MRIAVERREEILRRVRETGSVSVAELAASWGVPAVTVRRDIRFLADARLVQKVHGGAAANGAVAAGSHREPGTRAARGSIGLVVPSAEYYYPGVIRGARLAAQELGVRLQLAVSRYSPEADRELVSRLVAAGVDAVCVATALPIEELDELAAWLVDRPVPVVLVERNADAGPAEFLDAVYTDHRAGARYAVQHLAQLGHERIAFASYRSPSVPALLRGFRDSLADCGLDTPETDVHPLPNAEAQPREHRDAVRAFVDECVRTGTTAAFVHNDTEAMDVLAAVQERGLAVPADLALVAYDDEVAALAAVPMTAVAPPKAEIGRSAIEVAAHRVRYGRTTAPRRLRLLPTLNVRESSHP